MQISLEDAENIINKFFLIVPKVKVFLDSLGELGLTRGYIRSSPPYSRIRFFDNWRGSETLSEDRGKIERQSKNMPIQSTNADIIKLALVNTQELIDKESYPVNILLSVYDEIQTECEESFAEEWSNILEDIMKSSAETIIKTIPVVVDCGVSNYWCK